MKITQVMLSKGFGGAERLFVDFCRALADEGHQVQAVCDPEFEAITQLKHNGISVAHLRVRWDWSPLARKRLGKLLKEFSSQVIHSHLCRGSAVAGDAGRKAGIPVVANMHNYVNLKYYRNISHFCPGTQDQKHYLTGKGVREKDISVIPHFSMIPVAEEIVINSNESPVLVSYGRFVHKKGFHILLDAVKHLVDTGQDINLVLGGDGPEKEKLRNQTETLKLQKHIKFHGWVDNVSDFLTTTGSYFVLPSLDEPFGIVILEAMASGKVILASKSRGPEEILDATTAWFFELDDPFSLAEAIQKAISNPTKSTEKARAAQERYRSKYSPDRIIPAYISLYHEMIDNL